MRFLLNLRDFFGGKRIVLECNLRLSHRDCIYVFITGEWNFWWSWAAHEERIARAKGDFLNNRRGNIARILMTFE
jgi:hypothetical protein